MDDRVTLAGIDIGTTTTRLSIAEARILRNAGEGRIDLGAVEERLSGGPVRTPFCGEALDVERLLALMDGWLAEAQVPELFGGGALCTGLSARAPNVGVLIEGLRARIGDAVIAVADDPHLESWLAFQGSVGGYSRMHPEELVANLDIGGGTTNLALGRGGAVLETDCLWIGARHVEVEPGTYRITRLSSEGRAALAELRIAKGPGDELAEDEVHAVVDRFVGMLEAALPAHAGPFTIALSGGVGELVHDLRAGKTLPGTTFWGDLGIDLARRITASPSLTARLVTPAHTGRATVYGLLRHATRVSGATVFLGQPERLPLRDLPIVGAIPATATVEQARRVLALAAASQAGACLTIQGSIAGHAALRALGHTLAEALAELPVDLPLVLLVPENVGKALGGYATGWTSSPRALYVLDEVAPEDAHFVHVGRPRGGILPVAFHGMR